MSSFDFNAALTFTLDHEMSMVVDKLIDEFCNPKLYNEQTLVEQSSAEQNVPNNVSHEDQAMSTMDDSAMNVDSVSDNIELDVVLDAPNIPEV